MSMVVITLAGAVGALCRYVVAGLVQRHSGSDFPIGTLAVNLTGAFLVGLAAGRGAPGSLGATVAVGVLSGFTTFSTWMIETVRLGIPPLRPRAALNLTATLVAGVALAFGGYSLT